MSTTAASGSNGNSINIGEVSNTPQAGNNPLDIFYQQAQSLISDYNGLIGNAPSLSMEAALGSISAATKAAGKYLLGAAADSLPLIGEVALDSAGVADGLLNSGYYFQDVTNDDYGQAAGLAGAFGGALEGAEIGAGIGSVIPGLGTVIGGGVGSVLGGLAGVGLYDYVQSLPIGSDLYNLTHPDQDSNASSNSSASGNGASANGGTSDTGNGQPNSGVTPTANGGYYGSSNGQTSYGGSYSDTYGSTANGTFSDSISVTSVDGQQSNSSYSLSPTANGG
ncbi:hypothetical protein HF673_11885, partial [Acidithiobacillus thiooxidans]|nr:hypothetical protein [Acidithiobacillus thiooxidans]